MTKREYKMRKIALCLELVQEMLQLVRERERDIWMKHQLIELEQLCDQILTEAQVNYP